MRITIAGSSGLIGSALVPHLSAAGHDVTRLVRRAPRAPDEVRWDPAQGQVDPGVVARSDAIINLAGAGVSDKRWTDSYRAVFRSSRIDATRTLAESIAAAATRPVLVNASAIGFYGDRGDEILTEASSRGDGFLSDLVRDWEGATRSAADAGARVAVARNGLVQSKSGGALARQLPFFKLGLGGPLSDGKAWWSPISVQDEVAALTFLVTHDTCSGAYNLTCPNPLTNREFTRTLGRVLHRPTLLPVPALALRVVLGSLVEDVLASLRVLPTRLEEAGFRFSHPDAESIVRAALAP